tara:strand:+ start:7072 stop:7431 length:360 start_codon:yes stop_codon:yes gene_type:complete
MGKYYTEEYKKLYKDVFHKLKPVLKDPDALIEIVGSSVFILDILQLMVPWDDIVTRFKKIYDEEESERMLDLLANSITKIYNLQDVLDDTWDKFGIENTKKICVVEALMQKTFEDEKNA